MAEEEEIDENKRLRPREWACGQKNHRSSTHIFLKRKLNKLAVASKMQ